jgi:uncharacterized protein YoxC
VGLNWETETHLSEARKLAADQRVELMDVLVADLALKIQDLDTTLGTVSRMSDSLDEIVDRATTAATALNAMSGGVTVFNRD